MENESSTTEQAILKILLNNNASLTDITITSRHFQNSSYAMIFDAIKYLVSEKQPADVITVSESLSNSTGKNYLPLVTNILMSDIGSTVNVKAYDKLMVEQYLVRETRHIANELIISKCDPVAISETIKKLMDLERSDKNYEYDLKTALKMGIEDVDKAFKSDGALQGLNTGIKDLDLLFGGYQNSDLIVIAARPAMGKTAVLLNQMMAAEEMVGCISGEQNVRQAIQRVISSTSRVPLMNMRNGDMTEEDWVKLEVGAGKILNHKGVMFFDKASPSIEEIESAARKWKFDHDIKAIYVDYIQKIKRDERKPKAEAIGDNARRLKNLASELDIPVIALAQVKRDVESRNDKRPNQGDISDSSEIEKEADSIIMLYRDEVYNEDTEYKGVMELLVEKNRHGPTGVVRAAWEGKYVSVSDLEYKSSYD